MSRTTKAIGTPLPASSPRLSVRLPVDPSYLCNLPALAGGGTVNSHPANMTTPGANRGEPGSRLSAIPGALPGQHGQGAANLTGGVRTGGGPPLVLIPVRLPVVPLAGNPGLP